MTRITHPNRRTGTVVALVGAGVLVTGLSSCSSGGDAAAGNVPEHRTFAFSGTALTVLSDYGKVDVRQGERGTVTVDRHVTAVGKTPADPTWRLEKSTLDLGTVCDDGYVGVCEVTYVVTVPEGTKVDVRD